MRISLLSIFCSFFLATTNCANAQSISYPVAAGDLSICRDSTLLTAEITGANSTTETVTVDLAIGNEYIPGSFVITSGSGAVTENITNLNTPVFTISGASSPFTFSLLRKAACGAYATALSGGSFKDNISVGGVLDNDPLINFYQVKYPTLTITQPSAIINAPIGSTHTRIFSFQNNGQGCVDTVFLSIDYAGVGLQPNGDIIADGVNFAPDPALSTATLLVYKIFGTPTFASGLCDSDPAISVSQPVIATNCNQGQISYAAAWGCNATSICAAATTTGNYTALVTNPALTGTMTFTKNGAYCASNNFGTITLSITNNGNGPANNVQLRLGSFYYLNDVVNYQGYYIDTASFMVNGSHLSVTTQNVVISAPGSVPACQVGLPSIATANLGSLDIPVGGTMTISYSIGKCSDGGACGEGHYNYWQTIDFNYQTECGAAGTSSFHVNPDVNNYIASLTPQLPAQVIAGSCFKLKIDATEVTNNTGANYIECKVTLPVGMTINNLATDFTEINMGVSPLPGYPVQVGQDVIIRYIPALSGQIFVLNICTPVTGACGIQNFPIQFTSVLDSTCPLADRILASKCVSASSEVICGEPCPTGGVSPTFFAFGRTSFGLPDNNLDGQPDAVGSLDFNKVDLDRYQPGDTLHTVYRSIILDQTSPASITSWNGVYADWNFNAATWTGVTAKVTIIKGATSYIATNVPLTAITAGTNFRADWSTATFTPPLTSPITYQQGDSVIVEADIKYTPPMQVNSPSGITHVGAGDPNYGATDAPIVSTLTHTVFASQAIPSGAYTGIAGAQFTCFEPKYAANVIGQWNFLLLDAAFPANGTSCNDITVGFRNYVRRLGGYAAKQFFPGEYRPQAIPDSVVLNIPAGWDYVGTDPNQNYTYYTTKSGALNYYYQNIPISITGTAATGITLKFDYKSALASGGIPFLPSEDGYMLN
ncbi:MAG: hypothetical protein RL660_3080, partial [Bacteroidota bacterium]